ncbi:RTA1-domain-containing protein [Tothia fuscella]|uniref:RTA1-domain-containing protein n=1 Tax=Tothia fuscella TaxID=1048955 RepID=A0A9P4U3G1_9PEZI|nr:RTA1-domain-containing protein [Tothia fuscella]
MAYTLESHNGYYLFDFNPTLIGAIIATILFVVVSALHLWRMARARCWYCIPFVLGGIFEIVGYAARAAVHNNTGELITFIIQNIFLLVAPALFAASIYMTLGRVMRNIEAEHLSPIRVTWLTKIFVIGDVLSFFVQSGGAGYQVKAKNASDTQMGQNIILAGLAIQIIMFFIFVVVIFIFQRRVKESVPNEAGKGSSWNTCINMLYATSLLILIRSFFRIIEYGMGKEGYLLQHEWPLYVFDGILMWLMMVVFFWWHPTTMLAVRHHGDLEFSPIGDGHPELRERAGN